MPRFCLTGESKNFFCRIVLHNTLSNFIVETHSCPKKASLRFTDIRVSVGLFSAIRLDPDTREKLDLLAKSTAGSKFFLISEAIRAYLREQPRQINAIKEGLDLANEGNFASDEETRDTFGKWGLDVKEDWMAAPGTFRS